jgi:hypothetical protein
MKFSLASCIAYYHIHKTGGTSFKTFLSEAFPDLVDVAPWPHHSLAEYSAILRSRGVDPEKLRILTTIRNPLDHVVSIYLFWRTKGDPSGRAHIQAAKSLSFNAFVAYYVASPHADCRVYDELLLINGALPANVIVLRLEKLATEADELLNGKLGLNIPVSIPHVNRSEHGPSMEYFQPETLRLVRDRYAWAFDQGYYQDPFLSCV